MGNKSCRNSSFRPWGVQAEDRTRIDSAGVNGVANPDSYDSRPFPVAVQTALGNPPQSMPQPQGYAVHQNQHTTGYASYPGAVPVHPQQSGQHPNKLPHYNPARQPQNQGTEQEREQVAVVENFDRTVWEQQQQEQQNPKPQRGQSTYHMGMDSGALLVLQQQSREYYSTVSSRWIYEDVIDRMEAAYLVLVERHKSFLTYLHKSQQQQMQQFGQVAGMGARQGAVVVQSADAQLKAIEANIERANAIRWESVNQQTAVAQERFDSALQRGMADDGIILALEQGTEQIESNGKQVSITGAHWARDKYKAALAELAIRDPQEYAAFWQNVNHVRLEIPKDWKGRYDGETMQGGVITCNPYISQQRMVGNTVHNVAHLSDRQSATLADSETYAEQREMAMWQRQGKQNMRVFA